MVIDDDLHATEREIVLTDKELWLNIWTAPRMVFRFIDKRAYNKDVNNLFVMAGVASAFHRAINKGMGDDLPFWGVVLFCIFLGGAFGWLGYQIYGFLIRVTGKWLGGKRDADAIQRVLAYAAIPNIVGLAVILILLVVFGDELFTSSSYVASTVVWQEIVLYVAQIVSLLLSIWSLVLTTIGIAQTQDFSIGKGILNLVLVGAVIIVPTLLLFVFIDLFQ